MLLLSVFLIVSVLVRASSGLASIRPSKPTRFHPHDNDGTKQTERTVVILFHKPPNVLTTHVSDDSRRTVYDEVKSMSGFVSDSRDGDVSTFEWATGIRSRLHAVGRLDADTTGLLLLTNDGQLVHHVTNPNVSSQAPQTKITKTYEALIMGHHDDSSLQPLWNGVDIGQKYGGMTKPVHDLQVLSHPNHKSTLVSVTISEGKNRQVRRMFHALGSGVMKLKRTRIGDDLTLGDLEEGQWRILSNQEVKKHLDWKPHDISFEDGSSSKQKYSKREKSEYERASPQKFSRTKTRRRSPKNR